MLALLVGVALGVLVLLFTLGSIAGALTAAVIGAGLYYVSTPVLAFDFFGIWILAAVSLAAGGAVAAALGGERLRDRGSYTVAAGTAVLVILAVSAFATTAPMFRADAYYRLLGDVQTVQFSEAIDRLDTSGKPTANQSLIDQESVILVDEHVANRRAQELLGSNPTIGSSYELGPFSKTRLNGDGPVVWAAPLDYTGFGPWSSSKGAPGYVWVDAHDDRKAGYVTQLPDGKDVLLRCTPNAWFGDNAERTLRNHGFASTGLTEYSFEIGPGMRPYYAVTAYEHRVGFSGSDPVGAVILDPQTCQGDFYETNRMPQWVNRVVSEDIMLEQVTDHGLYGAGWLNSWWAGVDVTKPSIDKDGKGAALVQTTRGGRTAWYVGISTPSESTGTLGFMLVDSRTKTARFFKQTGTTEFTAQGSLQGLFSQQAGWTATLPVLYNIFGHPTYMSIIEDATRTVKGIGMIQVSDVNVVVKADDLQGALQAYASKLANQGPVPGAPVGDPLVVVNGTVKDIASVVRNGNTVFYILMENRPGMVFSVPDSVGPQVALTHPGQTVRIQAQTEIQGVMSVQKLDNLAVMAAKP